MTPLAWQSHTRVHTERLDGIVSVRPRWQEGHLCAPLYAPWPPRARLQRVRHPGEWQIQVPRVPEPLLQRAVLPASQSRHSVRATPTTAAPHRCVHARPFQRRRRPHCRSPSKKPPRRGWRRRAVRLRTTLRAAEGTDPRHQRRSRSPPARLRRTTPTRTACASRRRTWSAFVRALRRLCAFRLGCGRRPAARLSLLLTRRTADSTQ